MRLLLVFGFLYCLCAVHPALAQQACTRHIFEKSADTLQHEQAAYYVTGYEQGKITMADMTRRLIAYAAQYSAVADDFKAYLDAQKQANADFNDPMNYVRILANFLASIDVDAHMTAMCDPEAEEPQPAPHA